MSFRELRISRLSFSLQNGYMMTQDHEYHLVLDREHIGRRRGVDSALHVKVTKRAIDGHMENVIDKLDDTGIHVSYKLSYFVSKIFLIILSIFFSHTRRVNPLFLPM